MKSRLAVLVLCGALLSPLLFADQGHHHDYDPNEKVGTVHFPTSCDASVQTSFERGVALLHSFWYEQARKQFVEIENADPKCAMAYWGDAMTYWHPLWGLPDDASLQAGAALIEKAQTANAKTERERGYIAALAAFYGNYQHRDHSARAADYSSAMQKLYAEYPNDDEAGAFYALSLLSSSDPNSPAFASQKKAVALLDAVRP